MKIIYKYSITENASKDGFFYVNMPKNSNIIHLSEREGAPHIWAEVDPEMPLIERVFKIVGTGEEIKNREHFIYRGTYFISFFVWHVFELKKVSDEI